LGGASIIFTDHFEGFPKAIDDIVRGRSIIKCNFHIGESWIGERAAELEGMSIDRVREVMGKMGKIIKAQTKHIIAALCTFLMRDCYKASNVGLTKSL
jgi:hypothetical protein